MNGNNFLLKRGKSSNEQQFMYFCANYNNLRNDKKTFNFNYQ